MLRNITLVSGPSLGSSQTVVPITGLNLVVGPNNSGKSLMLRELLRLLQADSGSKSVIDSITFSPVAAEVAEKQLREYEVTPDQNDHVPPGHFLSGKYGNRRLVPLESALSALLNPDEHADQFANYYARFRFEYLDGQSRFSFVSQVNAGDLKRTSDNALGVLFRDNAKRKLIQKQIFDGIGLHFVIDPTALGSLSVSLSKRDPGTLTEERSLSDEAVAYYKAATPISSLSDGIKAYVGTLISVVAGNPEVILIDEPEAFLHPSLAYLLGKQLATLAASAKKQIVASTHSSHFILGCLHGGTTPNVIRLTYKNEVATARLLDSSALHQIVRNPLLRSSRVLEGLFFESVVVTEGDSDRCFYQEINDRLLVGGNSEGIPNCLFINAHNKQTVRTIIDTLRGLGIPAAGIVDIDVIKEGEVWTRLMESAGIPKMMIGGLQNTRAELMKAFHSSGKDLKREGGNQVLAPREREAAESLFKQVAGYGIFVVPVGEVEAWLAPLGVSKEKSDWLSRMFEALGDDPNAPDYVKAGPDDVWAFMREIRNWTQNPARLGISSGQPR